LLTGWFLIHAYRPKVQPIDEPKPNRRLTEADKPSHDATPAWKCLITFERNKMNTKFAATALILASSLIASTSFADVTRTQVKAELSEAIRTGDMMAVGEGNLKLNELHPNLYPAKTVTSSLTRTQVKAELAEAIRTGNQSAGGDSNLKLNELHPNLYPAQTVKSSLTRTQVKAELAEAIRTGNQLAGGESKLKLNELFPNRYPTM
jgi:hypothetical protein